MATTELTAEVARGPVRPGRYGQRVEAVMLDEVVMMDSTKEGASVGVLEIPAWQMGRDAYQTRKGVHRPWIAEISPVQYGRMSKRGKVQYDNKRSAEWGASAKCAEAYRAEVMAGYDKGAFSLEHSAGLDVHPEARNVVTWELRAREAATVEARYREAVVHNEDLSHVGLGDTVFCVMTSCYAVVVKVFPVSVRLQLPKGAAGTEGSLARKAWLSKRRACRWLHHNELKRAAAASITPDREALCKLRAMPGVEE